MKTLLQAIIILITLLAIYGTFGLALNEWERGNICPKILGIRACYIVLLCFVVAFISSVIPHTNAKWVYFFFVGFVTIIATTGTVGEILEITKCPRTGTGIPMCYISFGICFALMTLKIAVLRFYSGE